MNSKLVYINDGTITQLKNNGGLRLIRDKEVIEKINAYYIENASFIKTESKINEFSNVNGRKAGEIFNCLSNINFIDSINLIEKSSYKIPNTQLKEWLSGKKQFMLTTDIKLLSPFINDISYHMGLMGSYISKLKRQKEAANELMQSIQKNYYLENE